MTIRASEIERGDPQAYRSEMYDQYVDVQAPNWADADGPANAIWGRAAIHRLKKWLPADKTAKCLDLGCGAGHLMQALRSAGYDALTGVDLAPDAVALARKKGLNVTRADAKEFLKESQDSYDIVLAFDLVEHLRKDELLETLRLIRKRLTPNGVFIFQTPNALSPWSGHYRYGDLTHELILNQRSAQATLKLTGFGSVEVTEVAPFVHGLTSAIRFAVWKVLWMACGVWNLAETGCLHGGVYTRNMMVKAARQGPTA